MATVLSAPGYEIDGRPLLGALRALGRGDFSVRLPLDQSGVAGEVSEAFNNYADLVEQYSKEVERVSAAVGVDGKLSQRAALPGATGGWALRIETINELIDNLVRPTIEMSRVIGAVGKGDFSERMSIDIDGTALQGEFVHFASKVNTMADRLNAMALEVTRVAREVGFNGKLGGQAVVEGVGGTWKELTDTSTAWPPT